MQAYRDGARFHCPGTVEASFVMGLTHLWFRVIDGRLTPRESCHLNHQRRHGRSAHCGRLLVRKHME